MVATNHLGPFLLTNLLLDRLRASAPARIVVVASEAHRNAERIDLERLAEPRQVSAPRSFRLYGATKLMNILFTQELARRLAGSGVTANCMCPGVVATSLLRERGLITRLGPIAARTPFVRRPEQGARMAVRLATDPELAGVSGRFFTSTPGMRFVPAASPRRDAELQRGLWERSAELVGLSA